MKKNKLQRGLRTGIAAALILAGWAQAQTQTISEVEINHPILQAQRLDFTTDQVTVEGVLGNVSGPVVDDLDFYYFYATAGEVFNIDIDGAAGGLRSFDSYIAVFKAEPGFPMLRESDDSRSVDSGSISITDSFIENFQVPSTGNYVIMVTNSWRYPMDGGVVGRASDPDAIDNGDYRLIITRVTPAVPPSNPVTQINIDIKPGSTGLAPLNPRAKGKIPVALLSSPSFNALNANPSSLTFGTTGNEGSLSHCGKSGVDVNRDGRLDLVCHFENQDANFEKGDLEGILRGRTVTGTAFEGRGRLKVIPEKRNR